MPKPKEKDQTLPSLSRVFGYVAVKELRGLEDRVKVLARLGYPNKEIAVICGTTPASVATLKSRPAKGRSAR
jgi:DNA-binding CsgD family transcriptional regulator